MLKSYSLIILIFKWKPHLVMIVFIYRGEIKTVGKFCKKWIYVFKYLKTTFDSFINYVNLEINYIKMSKTKLVLVIIKVLILLLIFVNVLTLIVFIPRREVWQKTNSKEIWLFHTMKSMDL